MNNTFENLEFILLNIGYLKLNANWNWKDVSSPFARIYYVSDGEAQVHFQEKTYTLKPDYLYLIPPFATHTDECSSPFSLYYIHFYEKTDNKESIFDKFQFPIEVCAIPHDLGSVQRLLEINPERHLPQIDPQMYDNQSTFNHFLAANKKMPLHSLVESRGIIYQLVARFIEHRKSKSVHKNEKIKKVIQFIHENVNTDIAISELANMTYMSQDHFIRTFKKELGYTPLKYINLKKIERAQLLLLTSQMSIREVAIELSFDNISYFNRIFKQYTGKTPSQYRTENT